MTVSSSRGPLLSVCLGERRMRKKIFRNGLPVGNKGWKAVLDHNVCLSDYLLSLPQISWDGMTVKIKTTAAECAVNEQEIFQPQRRLF